MKKYLLFSILSLLGIALPALAADIPVEAMPNQLPEIKKIEDPYYIMNSANLNTMNSYVIPTTIDINPEKYPDYQYILKNGTLESNFDHQEKSWIFVHIMSTYPGYIIMWFLFLMLWYFGVYRKESSFSQVFKIAFEWIWNFFEGILGEHRQHWIKMYVVTLFFVILISNLFGVINDIVRFFAPQYLRWVTAPTGEFESNIALAIISIAVTLYAQAKALWGWHKLAHEFVPITWKWLVDGKWPIAKWWDILISLFTWFLDIIGTIAKIISLSIRLLGNMSSWSILLNVIFIWIWMLTVWLVWFNLQLWLPIIVYIQSLLGSVIQAFVFALLVGIGIMMAQGD
jgi:F0F1-type ATP synthase membrane subunit a